MLHGGLSTTNSMKCSGPAHLLDAPLGLGCGGGGRDALDGGEEAQVLRRR